MTVFSNLRVSIFFILILQIPVLSTVKGQLEPSPIEKSTEKVLYQGKIFFVHVVKKGQTLYSICRTYNVTSDEIAKANPGVSLNPLSLGQVLHIPAENMSEYKNDTAKDELKDNFILHKVQPKETPFSLHIKYNVSVEEIYKFNKDADKGLTIGQIVKIPNSHSDAVEKKEMNIKSNEKVTTYEIKKGNLLYAIAAKYNVTESDLINANELLRWGLKPGLIIVIPNNTQGNHTLAGTKGDDLLMTNKETKLLKSQCDSILENRQGSSIKVALILPFYATESFIPDTLIVNDSTEDSDLRSKTAMFKGIGAVEFYEGVLLALDSLKKNGIKTILYVYDDEGDTTKTYKIIHQLDSVKPDIIIGPFNSDDARVVSKYCKKTATLNVSPLTKDDSIIKQNPFLFQPTPSSETEIRTSVNYLSQYKGQNIILVHKPELLRQDELSQFKEQLKNSLSTQIINDSSVFKELLIDVSMKTTIKASLRNDLRNIVIIVSTQEPDVSNVLTQLYTYSRYYDIIVFGLPSWQKFKNVRIDYLHDLQVTLFTPFYIDYNDEFVKSFVRTCRSRLGFEPYKTTSKGTGMNYTFYGYDLAFYILNAYSKYGKDALLCTDNYRPQLLLSSYKFERTIPGNCWENSNLNLIRYNKDFSIEKLDYKTLSQP
jgi:LysM repeat protein/ABC-type branched-subunit amino acid transport system substrate-binding protein